MSERSVRLRVGLTAAGLLLAVIGLGVRLAFLHLLTAQDVREQIDRNRRIESELAAPRGKIYDRHEEQNILALNLVVKDVCADPVLLNTEQGDPSHIAQMLAPELEVAPEELSSKLSNTGRRFVYLRRFMPEERADKIRSMGLKGIFFQEERVRYYPQGSFMCHVLGFVNHEGDGSAGIELGMERFLKGSPGYLATEVDARRRELYLQREQFVKPVEGGNVTLTIDQNIQYMVEKAMDETVEEYNAKGAWMVVQDVKTGEIMAMVSRPAYDLNEFRYSSADQRLNRAIGYVYEPGSTFKALAISAAINEGIVSPDTVFDCENGLWVFKKKPLRDYHAYDKLTVADGVKKSSNILTAKIAVSLGERKFYDYLRAFRVGRQTGIDLPGEEAGIMHSVEKWSGISITRIPIGQGVSVTAMQMLGIYCTIANDGYMMKPHIIKRVERSDGSLIYESRPEVIARPIRTDTARTMRAMLARVTEEGGTGRRASIEGFSVAGKTGTAQKPVAGGYSDTAHVASFVGFLPAENPEVAMIVVVDEPQPIRTGGRVAAPAFAKVAGQLVRYLDLQPSEQEQEIASR